jgi:hypothetical protein
MTVGNWAKQLKVQQLKQLLRARSIKEERGCVERSELEALAVANYGSLEEAQTILAQQEYPTKKKDQLPNNATMEELKRVLGEDRGVMNYTNYVPSQQHLERMMQFKMTVPTVFDNPTLTPRSKWFTHKNWSKSAQMPPYHIHFREELQEAIRALYECYSAKLAKAQARSAQRAKSVFVGSMSGLGGHVSIEERHLFPQFQRTFSNIDISFLYNDHKHLHREESAAKKKLEDLTRAIAAADGILVPREDILPALNSLLAFDAELMAHLGEEEEIVVPMTLASGRFDA